MFTVCVCVCLCVCVWVSVSWLWVMLKLISGNFVVNGFTVIANVERVKDALHVLNLIIILTFKMYRNASWTMKIIPCYLSTIYMLKVNVCLENSWENLQLHKYTMTKDDDHFCVHFSRKCICLKKNKTKKNYRFIFQGTPFFYSTFQIHLRTSCF